MKSFNLLPFGSWKVLKKIFILKKQFDPIKKKEKYRRRKKRKKMNLKEKRRYFLYISLQTQNYQNMPKRDKARINGDLTAS